MSLVLLIGASSSGKSTFARRHFRATEVISSDACRALAADDENAMDASREAFEILGVIASVRMRLQHTTVIDATNAQKPSRRPLLDLARANDVPAIAVVFDLPEKVLLERSGSRSDRRLARHVVATQRRLVEESLDHLRREGFRSVHLLRSVEDVDMVRVERQ